MTSTTPVRGRYAPSPTGDLHLGNIAAALAAWLSVRSKNGTFVLRMEDLDPPREVAGSSDRIIDDLAWLGLDWDEGPGADGPFAPYYQSQRAPFYDEALTTLHNLGRLFPSDISRSQLERLSENDDGGRRFPLEQRPDDLPLTWFADYRSGDRFTDHALWFAIDDRVETVTDVYQPARALDLQAEVGDFVVRRKDGLYAYQLAVAVDDALMQMSEVIRGSDLHSSTFRQVQVMRALGYNIPEYGHIPIFQNDQGVKMSKRYGSLTVRSLRDLGVSGEEMIGFVANKLGLISDPEPCAPKDLVDSFSPDKVIASPILIDDGDLSRLR